MFVVQSINSFPVLGIIVLLKTCRLQSEFEYGHTDSHTRVLRTSNDKFITQVPPKFTGT